MKFPWSERARKEKELEEEIRTHMQMAVRDRIERGETPEQAEASARREFGNVALVKDVTRDVWGRVWFEQLWQDLRYGARTLRKNPGFTAVAVLTLALGIGANTAIFSVVNTVLLQPLPYQEPDRLVMVWEDDTKGGYPRDTPAAANFMDWRAQNQVFDGMAALADQSYNLTGIGEPERIEGRRVSADLFPLLGVPPLLGRTFLPEEDQPGNQPVAVMSYGLWQRRFGADSNLIGAPLTLNGQSYTVIGIMPSHFQFPRRDVDLWVPIAFTPQEAGNRGRHYLQVVARLKPGITLKQAQADMDAVAAGLQQQHPEQNADLGAAVTPLHDQLVGDIKPALLVLLGAVGFVLLVACVNVANLLLARAAVRQREIAIRIALGAQRLRLIRQFLTESILLAALGGGIGLLLSIWGVNLLKSFIPEALAQTRAVTIDAKVLVFTLAVSLLTGLIFGLAPATQALQFNPHETLKEGGRDQAAGTRSDRIRGLLVTAEVAVSLVLLSGAGLLMNSFLRLSQVDPGFRTDNLLTMSMVLPQSKYPNHARRTAFYTDLISRVESLPGVRSAAITNWIPLVMQGDSISFSIEGRPDPEGPRPSVVTRVVSPHYFQTMGIRLFQGRQFDEQRDRVDTPPVVVINETMARRFWPGEDPVGRRITPGPATTRDGWLEIVGIVNDVRQFQMDAEVKPQMYLTYQQAALFPPRYLVVNTEGDPLSLASTVRATVWEIDKDQPVSNINSMEDVLSTSIARQRFSMLLLSIFAALALVLAAVGIYGVMSYSVAQRTREIGIRMALGARSGDVLKLVIGRGMKMAVLGVTIGLAAAFALTRFMESLLFGVSATDPVTFALIASLLTLVALLACYLPARRATKVDQITALRYE